MDFQKNITVEAPTLENLNLQTFDMKSIEEFVVSHKIQLDFAWHLFICMSPFHANLLRYTSQIEIRVLI